MKIRQEISFIDGPMTASQSDKIIRMDPANYSDAVWCVEVVAKVDTGSMIVQFLRKTEGGVKLGNGACTFTETSPTLKQSSTFLIPEPSIGELNEFEFRLDGTFTGGVVYQAKLVAYQTGNYIIDDPNAVAPRVGWGLLYNFHCWRAQSTSKKIGMVQNSLQWRVPTQSDYSSLRSTLGGLTLSGKRAKACRMPGHPLGGDCDISTLPYWSYDATFYGIDYCNLALMPCTESWTDGSLGYYGGAYKSGSYGLDGTGTYNNETSMTRMMVWGLSTIMGDVEYGHDISNWYLFDVFQKCVPLRLCRNLTPDETSLPTGAWGPKYIDYEGNEYRTVRVGNYMWLAENLRTTHFNDGTEIPFLNTNAARANATTPGLTSTDGVNINDATLGMYEDHWPYAQTTKDTPDIAITETVINIGNRETGKMNTAVEPLINPKYWQSDHASRNGTRTYFVEAWIYPTKKVGVTVRLQVDNGSLGSWVTAATLFTAVTGDEVYYARVPFTINTGSPTRTYRIACFGNTTKYAYSILGANIIVRQENGTMFRLYNHMATYGDVGGTLGLKTFLAIFRRKDFMSGLSNPNMTHIGYGVTAGTASIRVTPVQVIKRVQNYGTLYNFLARTDVRRLTAYGWRLPNYTDLYYLRGYFEQILLLTDALKLKSCRMDGSSQGGSCNTSDHPRWNAGGAEGTNDFGFNALPAGNLSNTGTFVNLGAYFTLGATDYQLGNPYCLHIGNDGNFGWLIIGTNGGAFTTRPMRWCTQWEFDNLPDGTIMEDYIGNDRRVYKTIKIGFHVITAEDLKETMFRNGDWVQIENTTAAYNALGEIAKGMVNEGGETLTNDTTFDWATNSLITSLIERKFSTGYAVPSDLDYEALVQLEVMQTGVVNGSVLAVSFNYTSPPLPPSWIVGILKYFNEVSQLWEAPPVKVYQLGAWAPVTPMIPET